MEPIANTLNKVIRLSDSAVWTLAIFFFILTTFFMIKNMHSVSHFQRKSFAAIEEIMAKNELFNKILNHMPTGILLYFSG